MFSAEDDKNPILAHNTSAMAFPMTADDPLLALLQTYTAEYAVYASLILTGSLGALTVLLIRATTKKGCYAYGLSYALLSGVALFSVWRLMEFTRKIYLISKKLGLLDIDQQIHPESMWAQFFERIVQNMDWVIFLVIGFGVVLFCLMWKHVENAQGTIGRQEPTKPQATPAQVDDSKKVDALLAEYEACHMNRDHYDSVRWTISSVLVGASLASFAISFLEPLCASQTSVTQLSVFSVIIVCTALLYHLHIERYVRMSIERFWSVEEELDKFGLNVRLHRTIRGRMGGIGKLTTLLLFGSLILAWVMRVVLFSPCAVIN